MISKIRKSALTPQMIKVLASVFHSFLYPSPLSSNFSVPLQEMECCPWSMAWGTRMTLINGMLVDMS